MLKKFTLFSAAILMLGCTNLDERHVFNYKIEGTVEHVEDMHVVMGPGLDWRANENVELPVDISHDIYGDELEYVFEAFHSDPNADFTIQVFIDDKLIEQKSELTSNGTTNSVKISGLYKRD